MKKNVLLFSAFVFLLLFVSRQISVAKETGTPNVGTDSTIRSIRANDTIPPDDVMEVVKLVINSTNNFNVDDVANLYTPNAVISDDEPPYSWNGPTAGVMWVNAIEQTCKQYKITRLKATIKPVNVFQLSADNIYIVVPVSYGGEMPHKSHFAAKGAFTFVLRMINGKWLVKSQAWMPEKAI